MSLTDQDDEKEEGIQNWFWGRYRIPVVQQMYVQSQYRSTYVLKILTLIEFLTSDAPRGMP
jgi:hypothetical protein